MKNEKFAIKKICLECGREQFTSGHFIKHKSGTISAMVYNCEDSCICKMISEKTKVIA